MSSAGVGGMWRVWRIKIIALEHWFACPWSSSPLAGQGQIKDSQAATSVKTAINPRGMFFVISYWLTWRQIIFLFSNFIAVLELFKDFVWQVDPQKQLLTNLMRDIFIFTFSQWFSNLLVSRFHYPLKINEKLKELWFMNSLIFR